MNLTPRGKIYALIAFLSFVFSVLIVNPGSFPHLGLSLSFVIFTLFTYGLKKVKFAETKKFLMFTLAFSIFLAIRSDEFVTFLNFVSTLFFGSLMLTATPQNKLGFIEHAFNPVIFVVRSLIEKSDYYLEKLNNIDPRVKIWETIIGIVITISVMALVLPLLAFSNPIFEKSLTDIGIFLNLQNIFSYLNLETLFIWILRLVFFFAALFIIPKMITLSNKSLGEFDFINWKNVNIPLFIPKAATAIVIVVFCITQIQYYLATPESLSEMGITLSQRSREVFAQLTIVAAVIFALIYNDKNKERINNLLTIVLSLEALFLIIMAFKSVFDYINAWGFTHKRLYGVTVATFVLCLFILFINDYLNKKSLENFARKIVLMFGLFIVAVNLLNFDFLIYHFKKSTTGQGVDYRYLSTLSPDSLSYDLQLNELERIYESSSGSAEFYTKYPDPWRLLMHIDWLQWKYSNIDLRSYNLLEYLSYLKIKDVGLQKYYSMYNQEYKGSFN